LRHYSLAAKATIAYLHHDRGSFEEARATYGAVGFESQRQGRLLLTALVRIYEASLPGERQARITLLEETLRAIGRVDMRAIEALALATLVRLDPSRQDAAARARALLAQPNAVPSPDARPCRCCSATRCRPRWSHARRLSACRPACRDQVRLAAAARELVNPTRSSDPLNLDESHSSSNPTLRARR